MRELHLDVLDEESIHELARGERVRLMLDDSTVAEIVPINSSLLAERETQTERQRRKAIEELRALMVSGVDMGGYKIKNRDELYDRD